MTTRSQKRKAVAELASGDFETPVVENNSNENLIAGPRKNPRIETENLEEIKTSLRKGIMTDLTKILAENQTEIFKLIAPLSKKRSIVANFQESDSEPEDVPVTRTSTPGKTNTATCSKITPVNSRNTYGNFDVLIFPCCHQRLSSCLTESSNFWRQFPAVKFFKFYYASVLILNAAETSKILPPF